MRSIYPLLFFFLCISSQSAFGQGTQIEFGKNRVQFHQDFEEWVYYESQNFITYWYGEGRNVGQATVQLAELDFDYIQNILEHRMNDKIEIIVYTDLTDLKQTNIGSEETFVNTGGQTKSVCNKIFVHFDGNHQNLRRDIRAVIAEAYLNAMLFGSNLQEIVQNAVLMNLPDWFKLGLSAYVGEEWNTEMDNQLRNIFIHQEYESFDRLAEDYPKLAGHSMWYYISQNHGKATVANLLYLTRINRSIESGFLYVLGSSYRKTAEYWLTYFQARYADEIASTTALTAEEAIKVKNRRKLPLTQLKISPDGQKIAYVTNEIGKYKVYLHDLQSGDRKVILKGGHRNPFQATDYNYPLLAWNPNNQQVAVVYEKRDVLKYFSYDLEEESGETDDLSTQFQRVYSMDFINSTNLVFSAGVRGFSDLFIYKPPSRQTERLTNDFYDDLDATVVKLRNQTGVLFASNRRDTLLLSAKLDTILPVDNFDLFYYDLQSRSSKLFRVTNTPDANERRPVALDTTWYSYLSDESGVYNRYSGHLEDVNDFYEQEITLEDSTEIVMHQDSTLESLDSTLIIDISLRPVYKTIGNNRPNSNYAQNIKSIHTAPRANKAVEMVYTQDQDYFYVYTPTPSEIIQPTLTRYQLQRQQLALLRSKTTDSPGNTGIEELIQDQQLREKEDVEPITEVLPESARDTGSIDIDNYLFQSEFDDEEEAVTIVVEEDDESRITLQRPAENIPPPPPAVGLESKKTIDFRSSRIVPYRLKFRTDNVTTQLDNSLLFGGLNTYAGERQAFNFPPPGILLKGTVKDLFEDYELEGGVRIPTTFNGSEYFLIFDDKKKRIDKRYAFYRRSQRETQDFLPGSNILPRRKSLTHIGVIQLRYPFDIFTSLRLSGTVRADRTVQLATDRNTLDIPSLNEQRLGAKLEYVFDNTLDVALNLKNGTRYNVYAELVKRVQLDLIGSNAGFEFAEGFMTVLGLDARHYLRLDKRSFLAIRAAAATSFVSVRNLFFLGGVDNWLFPSTNENIPLPQSDDFAYQTLAANMRGFRQNIRNGNSYALINTELRVPIFTYFSRRIRSPFFRNFQIVGFFDLGTAWEGPDPFSEESPLNTVVIRQDNTRIKVNYFRDPVVAGYGGGIRALLFGYFLKLDVAWGIETRVVQDPILYFSMGTDF